MASDCRYCTTVAGMHHHKCPRPTDAGAPAAPEPAKRYDRCQSCAAPLAVPCAWPSYCRTCAPEPAKTAAEDLIAEYDRVHDPGENCPHCLDANAKAIFGDLRAAEGRLRELEADGLAQALLAAYRVAVAGEQAIIGEEPRVVLRREDHPCEAEPAKTAEDVAREYSGPPCAACGRPTRYRLFVSRDNLPPCCGSFRCEVKLRDGVELPPSPPRESARYEAEDIAREWQASWCSSPSPGCARLGPECRPCIASLAALLRSYGDARAAEAREAGRREAMAEVSRIVFPGATTHPAFDTAMILNEVQSARDAREEARDEALREAEAEARTLSERKPDEVLRALADVADRIAALRGSR